LILVKIAETKNVLVHFAVDFIGSRIYWLCYFY